MKWLELFAGTRSIGKAAEARGHEVFSVEWNKDFKDIDLYADILTVTAEDIIEKFGKPDVIWASPDCTTFSIAAISHHRRKNPETGNLDPVSEYAKFCDMVDQHVLELIRQLKPRFWFIENPRGGLRKMTWMKGLPRYTVTYCQYGDIRVKPPEGTEEGQINAIDYLGCWEQEDTLETTGCDRTGCIFCMFGCHREKEPNRFQRLKQTHPRQYEYCIGGGEMVDGKWQPNKEGLGLGHVLDYIGVKYV